MQNKKIIIAIDGYSSTGKSTIAKMLAERLGYIYVDTGAMYRAISLFAKRKGWIDEDHFDKEMLIRGLENAHLEFVFNERAGFAEMYLNGENVEQDIRSMDISNLVSRVAAVPEVRQKLVAYQKEMGRKKGLVMDGRDIGTVVFPDAELKLFLTASPEIRARRRYKEMHEKNEKTTFEEVYENVVMRDRLDTSRKDSPLVMAADAIEVDNSELRKDEQFELILNIVKKKLKEVDA
jgi:cytidylate kinase